MDDDLAFCLSRFIDEQVQLIEERIKEIDAEETEECEAIEEKKLEFDRAKPPPRDKGSHDEEQRLVDRFIRDLRDNEHIGETRTIIEDETCLDSLRAEITTKVGACAAYLNRIRNLARPLPTGKKFVEACNESIDYCRRPAVLEKNFQNLCAVLKLCDETNVEQQLRSWWNDAYGTRIRELNRRNEKIHPAVNENGFAIVSPTSRIIAQGKSLLKARKVIVTEAPVVEVMRQFVRQHLAMDEDRRMETNEEDLVQRLTQGETHEAVEYAQRWLNKRDAIRNHKEEDPYEEKLAVAKAEFGRRRIAQEAKKLAVAAILCRLAIGSDNTNQFEQKLKKTLQKQNQAHQQSIAVVSGDVKQPKVEPMPIAIQLDVNKNDMGPWKDNNNDLRERFCAGLCQAFQIPKGQIQFDRVGPAEGLVHVRVLPPHGAKVADCLNGNALDAAARMKALKKCCRDLHADIESITLGEFGLKVKDKLMDPRWNKEYIWSNVSDPKGSYWKGSLDRGGKPYFCPTGWTRYGIKVAEDGDEFERKWGDWYIAYHGTRSEHASNILTSGLRVSTGGCFYEKGIPRVYVSPSIEYCAHPRYAMPWKQTKKNGQTVWYQLVFQCRVNPKSIEAICPETLVIDESKGSVLIDANFGNDELEWIILGKGGAQYIKKDIICYGLMVRTSSDDPHALQESQWWPFSISHDHYL